MKRKHNPDYISVILMIAIIVTLLWIGHSLLQIIQFSNKIEIENHNMAESKYDFDALKKRNSDICAWITINNTNIDFPIVQTTNNVDYLTTSAYGENAAYGAIFLDYRNNLRMEDYYSLVYGHHMTDGNMFGDIDKFDKQNFFKESTGGTLSIPDESFDLSCVAFLIVPSNTKIIYDPTSWNDETYLKHLTWIEENAKYINKESLDAIQMGKHEPKTKLIALSTCTTYDENLRYVLLLKMEDNKEE